MKTQCHKKINKWFISHVKTKFLFFKEIFYLYVGEYSDVQSPEEALDALELQVVSLAIRILNIGVRNRFWVLWKSSKCSCFGFGEGVFWLFCLFVFPRRGFSV